MCCLPRNWKRLVTPHCRLLRKPWPRACPPSLGHHGALGSPTGDTAPQHPGDLTCSRKNRRFCSRCVFGGSYTAFSTLSLGDFII